MVQATPVSLTQKSIAATGADQAHPRRMGRGVAVAVGHVFSQLQTLQTTKGASDKRVGSPGKVDIAAQSAGNTCLIYKRTQRLFAVVAPVRTRTERSERADLGLARQQAVPGAVAQRLQSLVRRTITAVVPMEELGASMVGRVENTGGF